MLNAHAGGVPGQMVQDLFGTWDANWLAQGAEIKNQADHVTASCPLHAIHNKCCASKSKSIQTLASSACLHLDVCAP